MRVRYTWDDHYLYVGYETFDRNLVALGTGQKEGPGDNLREGCAITHPTGKPDVVECFISFGDLRFFWEVHHNAANQLNDIWCVVVDKARPISKSTMNRFGIQLLQREYVQDDAATGRRLAPAVALKPKADGQPSPVNDATALETGYRSAWPRIGTQRPTASRRRSTTPTTSIRATPVSCACPGWAWERRETARPG